MSANRHTSIDEFRIFFSHGGEDTYVVNEFLRPKVEASGARVFVDAGGIDFGDDFRRKLLDELTHCDEFLVFLTRSSVNRAWVLAEVGAALVRQIRVVVIKYGVSDEELQARGILSLLGTNNLLMLDDFDRYVAQLRLRVEGKHNG